MNEIIAEMNNKKKIEDDNNEMHGFKRGLDAEKIIGTADDNGILMYLMQWWVKAIPYSPIFRSIETDWLNDDFVILLAQERNRCSWSSIL